MAENIYVGDYGTVIAVNCGTDISSAIEQEIRVLKPDGNTVTWAATVYQNNYLTYVTQEGDIDIPGLWKLQAYVSLPEWKGLGKTTNIFVYETYL